MKNRFYNDYLNYKINLSQAFKQQQPPESVSQSEAVQQQQKIKVSAEQLEKDKIDMGHKLYEDRTALKELIEKARKKIKNIANLPSDYIDNGTLDNTNDIKNDITTLIRNYKNTISELQDKGLEFEKNFKMGMEIYATKGLYHTSDNEYFKKSLENITEIYTTYTTLNTSAPKIMEIGTLSIHPIMKTNYILSLHGLLKDTSDNMWSVFLGTLRDNGNKVDMGLVNNLISNLKIIPLTEKRPFPG